MAEQTTELDRVPRVELEDAKRQYDAHTALFVDVRSHEDYYEGHIPGALSIPLHGAARNYATLPRNRHIILYCT